MTPDLIRHTLDKADYQATVTMNLATGVAADFTTTVRLDSKTWRPYRVVLEYLGVGAAPNWTVICRLVLKDGTVSEKTTKKFESWDRNARGRFPWADDLADHYRPAGGLWRPDQLVAGLSGLGLFRQGDHTDLGLPDVSLNMINI